jgi:dephospho-CoA kinase
MDRPKTIIALAGPLGAGKDTFARHLVDRHGFRRFAFADEIKRRYYAATGHSEEEFKEGRDTSLEDEIRKGLWQYSDHAKAEFGSLYFVKALVDAVREFHGHAVVTDIRTMDELDQMRACGAMVVLVVRVAGDGRFQRPPDEDVIPGSRLSYGDLRNDRLFVNQESRDPGRTVLAIETWCGLAGMV